MEVRPTNYAEYLQTPEGEIWQIIEGEPFLMSPTHNNAHQRVLGNLTGELYSFLKGKDCQFFIYPFDVRLFTEDKNNDEIKNIVQPDLSIICDPQKLDQHGCNGAPDLVVEVLSKSTAALDRGIKLGLYKKRVCANTG